MTVLQGENRSYSLGTFKHLKISHVDTPRYNDGYSIAVEGTEPATPQYEYIIEAADMGTCNLNIEYENVAILGVVVKNNNASTGYLSYATYVNSVLQRTGSVYVYNSQYCTIQFYMNQVALHDTCGLAVWDNAYNFNRYYDWFYTTPTNFKLAKDNQLIYNPIILTTYALSSILGGTDPNIIRGVSSDLCYFHNQYYGEIAAEADYVGTYFNVDICVGMPELSATAPTKEFGSTFSWYATKSYSSFGSAYASYPLCVQLHNFKEIKYRIIEPIRADVKMIDDNEKGLYDYRSGGGGG